jgi:hypothetical protein
MERGAMEFYSLRQKRRENPAFFGGREQAQIRLIKPFAWGIENYARKQK